MSVRFEVESGWPSDALSSLFRRVSAYTRLDRVRRFKLGYTNDPPARFRRAYAGTYSEMVVLYASQSIDHVSQLEAALVDFHRGQADNQIGGGGGGIGPPPYFLYVVLRYC